jgi:hypothetical protein
MIRDQRLKLASNLDIGASARRYLGIQVSDLLPTAKLGEFGRGEQLYCCVTVTTDFANTGDLGDPPNYTFLEGTLVRISLKEEGPGYTVAEIDITSTSADQAATMLHNHNPTLGTTGWILNNTTAYDAFGVTVRNFVKGKKFVFPINPLTHRSQFQTTLFPAEYTGGRNVYLLIEEVDAKDENFTGTGFITSGAIDADIVLTAESGASSTFNDVRYYPTGTIVR